MENKGSNKIICVYKDKKANLYTAPMLFDNEQTALRHFDNMSNRDINICDYDLYLIGFYNDLFGNIELLQNGEHYLLRCGDFYYDYISKVKDFNLKITELKEMYRVKYNGITEFAKDLYKQLMKALYDEDDNDLSLFYDNLENFLKQNIENKGDKVDE